MKYEIKKIAHDPFDIACGDCPVHEIEYWAASSLEELHQFHNECIKVDEYTPDSEKEIYEAINGEKWKPTPVDFKEFLREEIENGNIREIKED